MRVKLVRRVIECLLIEVYEHKGFEGHIKDSSTGNFLMLNGILKDALDQGRLSLNQDTNKVLRVIKKTGDLSAHNRRYIAVKNDLDSIRSGVRVAVDDLLHLAGKK